MANSSKESSLFAVGQRAKKTNHSETASTSKANKLKRKQANKSHQQVDTFEISSDEEVPIEKKSKNCIASRTRSKAPNPDKKSKSPIHTSASGINILTIVWFFLANM